VALDGIKVNTQQKLAEIKLASKAQDHALKMQISKDKAATSLATDRAKTQNTIQLDKEKAAQEPETPSA
jgi:hypothetical protein